MICGKCLQKDPHERYHSVNDLLIDLENHENHRPLLAATSQTKKYPSRSLIAASLSGAIIALLIWFFPSTNPDSSKPNSSAEKDTPIEKLKEINRLLDEHQQTAALEQLVVLSTEIPTSDRADLAPFVHQSIDATLNTLWRRSFTIPLVEKPRILESSIGGSHIAFIEDGNTLQVFDVHRQKKIFRQELDSEPTAITFHPDGQHLLVAAKDQSIAVFKNTKNTFEKTNAFRPSRSHSLNSVREMGFSIDGSTLFTTNGTHEVYLWDFSSRLPSRKPLAHRSPVVAAHTAQKANLLMTFTSDGYLYAWDCRTGQKHFGPVFLVEDLVQVAVSQDAQTALIISGPQRQGYLFDLSEISLQTTQISSPTPIAAPIENALFTNIDSKEFLYSSNQQLYRYTTEPHSIPVTAENFFLSVDRKTLITHLSATNEISVWTPPFSWSNRLTVADAREGKLSLSPDNSSLAFLDHHFVTIAPTGLSLSSKSTSFPLPARKKFGDKLFAIYQGPKRDFLYTIGQRDSAYLSSLDTKALEINWTESWVSPPLVDALLASSSDGQYIAILPKHSEGFDESLLTIFDVENKVLTEHSLPTPSPSRLDFSSKPNELIILSENSDLTWYDWKQREVLQTIRNPDFTIHSLDIDQTEGLLLRVNKTGNVSIHNEKTLSEISSIPESKPRPSIARFIPGRHMIACVAEDEMRLHDLKTGLQIGPTIHHNGKIISLNISKDCSIIMTGDTEGTVKFTPYPLKSPSVIDHAKNHLQRSH